MTREERVGKLSAEWEQRKAKVRDYVREALLWVAELDLAREKEEEARIAAGHRAELLQERVRVLTAEREADAAALAKAEEQIRDARAEVAQLEAENVSLERQLEECESRPELAPRS